MSQRGVSASSWTLEIIVYGLIGLVPSQDTRDVLALLVDGHSTLQTEHRPLLLVTQGICTGACYQRLAEFLPLPEVEPTVRKLGLAGYAALLHLAGRDLVMSPPLGGQPQRLVIGPTSSIFPTVADRSSLGWVPRMARIVPLSALARESCLKHDPIIGASACPVSSRFVFGGWDGTGGVTPCHYVHDRSYSLIPYFFVPPGGRPNRSPQAITDVVRFQWTLDGTRYPQI